MKKRLLAGILTALTTVSLFIGCGAEEDKKPMDMVTEITEPVTIEMWHYLTGQQQDTLNEIIDDFNEVNEKQITVKAVPQGSIADLNKKVIAAGQSNTLPAIINVYPDLATSLIETGKIIDLAPYIKDEKVGMEDDFNNDFIKSFTEEVMQWDKDKIYGIPLTKSTEVLYVNKTLLEKLGYTIEDLNGATMDKIAEISAKAKKELGIVGFGIDSPSNAFISTLKMDGADFVAMDSTINIDNDWVREYMDFYREQVEAGNFRTPGEDKFLSGVFSNQDLLAYQGSSAGAGFIDTNDAFELAVVEVPSFDGKDQAVIQQGASLFVTADTTPEQKYASYEFIKFATSKENTAKFALETGYLPVRMSAAETDLIKNAVEANEGTFAKVFPVAQKSLEYSYYTPAVNNAQSARSVAGEKFDAYVTGNIKSVDDFVKELQSQVETSIQRQ